MERMLAALPFLIAMACGPGSGGGLPTNPSTTLGSEFTLKPGGTATVTDADLKLKLEKVTDDSRCPVDVTCVWAGDAVAVVRLIPTGAAEETKELHINRGTDRPGEVERDAFVVKFVRLTPTTHSRRPIPPEDYRATFLVQRR
jgi:hypothetical protein